VLNQKKLLQTEENFVRVAKQFENNKSECNKKYIKLTCDRILKGSILTKSDEKGSLGRRIHLL